MQMNLNQNFALKLASTPLLLLLFYHPQNLENNNLISTSERVQQRTAQASIPPTISSPRAAQ